MTDTEAVQERGLTGAQVLEREKAGKVNTPPVPLNRSTDEIIAKNVFTYFNLIFAVLALLVMLVEDYRSLTFLPVVIVNTLVGIFQEIRSKKTLEKLTVLNAPKAETLRDGAIQVIPSEKLVEDDVVVFRAGGQIPADAQVLSGRVSVNEALLTGEADEIVKTAGDPLFSGSFVVSGECRAVLTKVGAESGISKLTLEAKHSKGAGQSKMIKELTRLVKIVGIVIIPVGIGLFLNARYRLNLPVKDSVTAMVAALIGMIPEGLYLLATLALVLSMMRLAKDNVLVHEMNCIEMLARVDVLCVDKTGTITEPEMKVSSLVPADGCDEKTLTGILGDFSAAMPGDNPTIKAMQAFFTAPGGQKAENVSTFSSEFKYSAAVIGGQCIVVGAPEFVLREAFQQNRALIEGYAQKGLRTLAVCRYQGAACGGALTEKAELMGLILLNNPIRKNAKETFAYFAKQGVEIKVISGDNPLTVSRVAQEAGILGAEKYVDASTLKTEEEAAQALKTCTVFGRVIPAQKRLFVRLLKQQGRTVAMTGDGVNDVLALKDADCSVAMASGSEAAAQCAQLVLMDSDFARMPLVVDEGRRVVNNIERSASLFLVKNIFSVIMALLSILFVFQYPITPAQMSLISGLTIGVPAFLLALEPNHNRIQGSFMKNVMFKALPAGLTDVVLIGALVLWSDALHLSADQMATASFILLAVVGLLIIYRISRPMNAYRTAIAVGMALSMALCAVVLNDLFRTVALPKEGVICVLALSALALPLMLLLTRLMNAVRKRFVKA